MAKQTVKIIARSLISIALLGWLALSIDWRELARILPIVKWEWIISAVVWIILSMLISVFKWRCILKVQQINLPYRELWQAYWAGLFFNNFLPSSIGGDALRIWWVREITTDTAGAAASVVIERILATAGLALTGLGACLLVSQADYRIVLLFIVLIVFSMGLLALIVGGHLPFHLLNRFERVNSFMQNIQIHGNRIRGQWFVIGEVIALSVAFQIAVVGVNYSIFQALNLSSVGWIDALYIVPFTSVAAMLPIGINGYGIREGAYVAVLSTYGVPSVLAFTSSIMFAFLVSICSLYGAWTWLNHRSKGVSNNVSFERI